MASSFVKSLSYGAFSSDVLAEEFFDSLKQDYSGFTDWYSRKVDAGDNAYTFRGPKKRLDGFLYLKIEDDSEGIVPPLPVGRRLKVGTLKINAHGTRLGERFIKKVFDNAIDQKVDYIYVTVFAKHESLVELFLRYGFLRYGTKETVDGIEDVFVKDLTSLVGDPVKDFPRFDLRGRKHFLLAIYPEYHSSFLPESILKNESYDILEDVSHTNSIHKIYISGIARAKQMRAGDIIVIYRTTDRPGHARFRSVASSIVVVEEVRQIKSFATESEFVKYTKPYSVFTKEQLKDYFTNKGKYYIIKFTYNAALTRRIIRGRLIDECGISTRTRWDLIGLSEDHVRWIADFGGVNEGLIVN
ncbi:N-acetyltransferase [Pseudomonas trivialis]|uniref:N-acetyltransferase n=1 Tax=Pseudomonas orientalis TaxID=76758 RepID=A0A4Q7CYG6_9PSED|nr:MULTISPECIES: acetyltransferase [Pseudomonas]RZI31504.1 N-acetyltransferase [Pseudomonas orientalis]CRM30143.1 hypothetical protein [Pseudomonas sp. 44 R 15]